MRPSQDIATRMLEWGKTIRAISRTGLSFSTDFHNKERYQALRQIASEILATINADLEFDRNFAAEMNQALRNEQRNGISGYVTPKVAVAAAVFNEHQQILLVRSKDSFDWCLPGGWADEQWTPAENAQREVQEETNLIVRTRTLLGVFDSRYHRFGNAVTTYTLLFECELLGGELTHLVDEIEAARFYDEDDLPLLIEGSRRQVRISFDSQKNRSSQPFFDE